MIVGVTGTIGAGKGAVAAHLARKGFRHVSVSGFLADEAARRGKTQTRSVLRELGNEFRARGATALLEAVLEEVNPLKEHVVIESLHTVSEVEFVRGLGGMVIAVDAPPEVRHERVRARGGGKDSLYEEFLEEEKRQMISENPNENNLRAAIESADYRFENAGSEEELFEKVDAALGA